MSLEQVKSWQKWWSHKKRAEEDGEMVGSFMDWQTKKIEIKGLIKNSSGCQWDKVYDSKEEESNTI